MRFEPIAGRLAADEGLTCDSCDFVILEPTVTTFEYGVAGAHLYSKSKGRRFTLCARCIRGLAAYCQ